MLSRVLWYCYELSRNQRLKPTELKRLQERRLKAIIRHAYDNVPLYRRKFDSEGIRPEDIRSMEDLSRLPFTTKQEVRDGIPDQSIARGYDADDCVRMPTSGTSGGPMPAIRDKRFWDYCVAYRYHRRPRALGVAPWDKILEIYYNRPDTAPVQRDDRRDAESRRKSRGREALGPSFSLFKRWIKTVYIAYSGDEIIGDILEYKPGMIYANASYLRLLAETISERGIHGVNPKSLISWGEVLDEPTREFLESSIGCEVFNYYGAYEIGPIACEWRSREGLHVLADFVILEIVRDGEPVGPDERGEIVVTGLLNYAMPMIRYRVGDIGTLSDRQCTCGSSFPLLKSVEGRMIDCFTLPGGRLVSPKSIQSAIQAASGVSRYQAVQQDERKVTIELMRKEDDPEVSTRELVARCRDVLGDDVEIEVTIGDRKDLKAKFRPVISKLTVSGDTRWIKPRRSQSAP